MGCGEAHGEERWVLFPQHLFVILPPLCVYKIHSVMCICLSHFYHGVPVGERPYDNLTQALKVFLNITLVSLSR